ncbi:MAG: ABC transporter permease [Brooklawnia sp.]|nr:ABC transporter permease [Brooklawnia sp.]
MTRLTGRVVWFAGSLLMASLIVFALLNLLPGDLAGVMLGPNATPEAVEALRGRLGLDRPWPIRYLEWIAGLFSGQLGASALTGQPIAPMIVDKFGVTFSLVVFGMFFAVAIALPLGIHSALRRHHADGVVVAGISQFGMALPVFVVGIGLSLLVGVRLRWLPANGYVSLGDSLGGWASHLVLPAFTLGLVQGAVLVRYVRSAFIDVLNQDYFRTARAIGWRRWPALLRHGLRNAALQLVTIVGLQFATLFVGAIVVESVFVLPGLGSYLLQMVANRDIPVVQTIVMLLVTLVLVINLLVDLSYAIIDPRLRTGEEQDES